MAASCVSVPSFGLGLTVCQSLLEYYQTARRSREDAQILCESTEALRQILEVLQKTIDPVMVLKTTQLQCSSVLMLAKPA